MTDSADRNTPGAGAFLDEIQSRFGLAPTVAARAPGRVNLIGEHVDYSGGLVMPIAIPQACFAAVIPARSGATIISSSAAEEEIAFDPTRPVVAGADAPVGSWPSYALGVVAGFQALSSIEALAGYRIHVHTDVPVGAGLSSSAALEVAVGVALAEFLGVRIGRLDLAKLCQRAEHDFAGVPCGLMDQAASALARDGHALILDCATDNVDWAPFMTSAHLAVVHSGVSHALADGAYAKRRAACETAADHLGVQHLAHASVDAVAALPEDIRRFARHVVTEQARVHEAIDALREADAPRFGALMTASHASLRDDFRVSCPEIDALVDAMGAAPGCFGARMTGGGFGGCVIALTEPGAEHAVLHAAERRRDLCPRMRVIPVHAAQGASLLISRAG